MKLASLLREKQIIPNMVAEGCRDAIVELIDKLSHEKILASEHKEEILDALQKREDQTSTGIGSGVAIPHAFSDKLDEVVAIFGRSINGIEFEALDNAPVKFVLLIVVPKKNYHSHLQALSEIAKMFKSCDFRTQLEAAESSSDILKILDSRDSLLDADCA